MKQQKFRERRYPIKPFTVLSSKVSTQQYYIQWDPHPPSPLKLHLLLVACTATPKWFQNDPHFCSSKSHKYDKPDKVSCIVSSYHYSHKANLKAVLICSPKVKSSALDMMIWSLIPHAEQPLNKFASQNLPPICHWKPLEKCPSILYEGHYALAPLENNVGVYAPSKFAQNCGLKLVKILNLAKTIVWQNRSVGWGIRDLEFCHLNKTLGHSIETY